MNATPITNVRKSSAHGAITSKSVASASTTVPARKSSWVERITQRRSTMSESAPATRPKMMAGAVLAVCTSATMSGDGVIVAMSHAAMVACMV